MSAFREYWIVVKDSGIEGDSDLTLQGGNWTRHRSEKDAHESAEYLARRYQGNAYVVMKATAAYVSSGVQRLDPAPF